MKQILRKHILIIFILAWVFPQTGKLFAQDDDTEADSVQSPVPNKVTVNNIFVIGNEKTRKSIILREINVQTGIQYDWDLLIELIEADQKKIYNLQLFNSVEITPLFTEPEQIELLVSVTERWYIIPNIIFNLADRNFAEWWTNQDKDLSRVNFGARLIHNNVGGRNEKLRIGAQFGFIRSFELQYSKPYIDRKQRHGLAFQLTYFTQKNLQVKSENNKQVFYTNEAEEVLRQNFSTFLRYTYRGSYYNFHFATIGYNRTKINEDVFTQNPNYLLGLGNQIGYTILGYTYRHDDRDNVQYATEGEVLNASIFKYGLLPNDAINDWEISLTAAKYFKLSNRFHFATGLSATSFIQQAQPYTLVRGIGYNPYFVRGYELNVIEGQQAIVQKNSLRYKILDLSFNIGKIMPLEEFSYFPLRLFLSTNFDHGFVNDRNKIPSNARLTNTHLFGYGMGLDLVTFYDMVFRFEYSVNNQNEGTFFFNFRAPF